MTFQEYVLKRLDAIEAAVQKLSVSPPLVTPEATTSEPQQLPLHLPGTRTSRITIARLYNTGNYEHTRYELTVDVAATTCPSVVVQNLESLLDLLNPKPPHSAWSVNRAQKLCSMPQPPEDSPLRGAYDAAVLVVQEAAQWQRDRDACLAKLDKIGLSTRHGDAKAYWDDEGGPA